MIHPIIRSRCPLLHAADSHSQEGDPCPFEKSHIADQLSGHGLESEIVVRPHLLVPPGVFGGFYGTDDQRVETVPALGLLIGRVGYEAGIHQSMGKKLALFSYWRAPSLIRRGLVTLTRPCLPCWESCLKPGVTMSQLGKVALSKTDKDG